MEPTTRRDAEEREQLRKKVVKESSELFNYFWPLHPIQLFVDILWSILRLFRPLAPHLVPLAVFSAAIPFILFLSIGSGYLVWKSVAVSWETELFLQYGDGGSPFAELTVSNIVPLQPYDISVHLVVPANQDNFALGNFMTSLTLSTLSNNTISTSRKPTIVLPPSATPWSYLYNRPGTVDLNIPMFSDFVIGTSRALARVELGRRDQWRTLGEGHGRELSVLSGTIRGTVKHHGIRGLISRFPLTSAFVATGVFFFIMFVGLVVCLMPALEWHFGPDAQGPQQLELEPEDKPRKRPRSRRPGEERGGKSASRTPRPRRSEESTSRSGQTRTPRDPDVKTEGEEEWLTSRTASETSIRRRLSHPPESDDLETF